MWYIDPEKDIMAGRLPKCHWIFDHFKLEGVFSAALPTPRGWKALLSGEGWQGQLLPLYAEDVLNHKAEQLQGVDLRPDHPGARLQGRLVPYRSWQRKGALT